MTVFVVHGVRDDISPACKFGTLRLINHAYIHGDELRELPRVDGGSDWAIPDGYRANMELAAASFDSRTDYLLIAGDHLQLLAMAAILAARFPSFMVLRYDRQLNDYIPVRLHSGLVSPPSAMVESGMHIGEHPDGEDRRISNSTARFLATELRAGIEAPLSRHDPVEFYPKRPA